VSEDVEIGKPHLASGDAASLAGYASTVSMVLRELEIAGDTQGSLFIPEQPSDLGVLVVAGSSGRVDTNRAKLFAERGAVSLAQRWFGRPGQAPGINEIPLEIFVAALDCLRAEGCRRLAMVGISYGALAALLTAINDPRLDLVVAISPSHVVWQSTGAGLDASAWPPRSSFTWKGEPLPFVVWDPRAWPKAGSEPPSFRKMHEASLRTFADDAWAAAISIEDAKADVMLVAGGADALWPSDTAAVALADRLRAAGKTPTLLVNADAGHCPYFPAEPQPIPSPERAWGGNDKADRSLGGEAWNAITQRLGLRP